MSGISMPKEKISKLEAARRQINAAVKMFFNSEEPLATHTVISAALELASDLVKSQNQESFLDSMLLVVREDKRNAIEAIWRHPQNFLKHADRDPEDIFEYNSEALEFYIIAACITYLRAGGKITIEISGFSVWFFTRNPTTVNEPGLRKAAEDYSKQFGAPSSSGDKKMILEAIQMAKDRGLLT